MENIVSQFFNAEIAIKVLPLLLKGLLVTLEICAITIPIGLATGLAVALMQTYTRSKIVRFVLICFVDFFRAMPPLVTLIFMFSGLPFFGVRLSPIIAVSLTLILSMTVYYGEVYRAGLESVGRGQYDAGTSTGLSRPQVIVWIVIPQAVRNVLPDLISNTIEVVKLSSLASVVAIPELLFTADMARASTFNATPMLLAALIYLAVLWPCVRLLSRMEHKSVS
jgi:polar amino acid transport system permease protein